MKTFLLAGLLIGVLAWSIADHAQLTAYAGSAETGQYAVRSRPIESGSDAAKLEDLLNQNVEYRVRVFALTQGTILETGIFSVLDDAVAAWKAAEELTGWPFLIEERRPGETPDPSAAVSVVPQRVTWHTPLSGLEAFIPLVTGFRPEDSEFHLPVLRLFAEVSEMAASASKQEWFSPYVVESNYRVTQLDTRWLSIVRDHYYYTGGAHGMTVREADTWDIRSGRRLMLADLLSSKEAAALITQAMAAEPEAFLATEVSPDEVEKEAGFYLEEGQLIVFFQLYRLAPYAEGFPEFDLGEAGEFFQK